MTGTPSKDRAELVKRLRETAAERSRAVAEQENANLMVVARISQADARLMSEAAEALANSFAEGMKRAAEICDECAEEERALAADLQSCGEKQSARHAMNEARLAGALASAIREEAK